MKQLIYTLIGVVVIGGAIFIVVRSKDSVEQLPEATPVAEISPENHGEFVAIAPVSTPEGMVPSVPSVTGATVAVSMSDEAFEPDSLTIKAGDTVVFTNNGQALHWIASDPHPVHTNLSAFDAKKGIPTGETYSYTFMEKGTFGMHDHLHASIKGTIVVE